MIMMQMKWPEASVDQYDEVKRRVNWEGQKPDGAIFHTTAHDGNGLVITDVWRSADEFQRFIDSRVMPVVKELGVPGEPQVEIYEAHDVFAPAFEPSVLR